MSEKTGIEWCDSTFNPWIGCTKVGPGCDHCYAETMDARKVFKGEQHWGPGVARMRTSDSNWNLPYKWNDNADKFFAEHGRRQRVFCASLADVFDKEVDPAWRADLIRLIEATPNLDWLILTKRIGNVERMIEEATDLIDYGHGFQSMWAQGAWPENVWLGATICNQAEADRDIQKLLTIPAKVRFLSMEPLLGPVDLSKFMARDLYYMTKCEFCGWVGSSEFCSGSEDEIYCHSCRRSICGDDAPGIDWVIVGGESGAGARPMNPTWVKSLRDQCAAAAVPFLFKQWGEWEISNYENGHFDCNMTTNNAHWVHYDGVMAKPSSLRAGYEDVDKAYAMVKVGKHKAGRMLDGITHDGYPKVEV